MPEEGDSRGMEGAPPRGPRCHQGFSPDGCAYRRRGFEKAPRRLLEGSWKCEQVQPPPAVRRRRSHHDHAHAGERLDAARLKLALDLDWERWGGMGRDGEGWGGRGRDGGGR